MTRRSGAVKEHRRRKWLNEQLHPDTIDDGACQLRARRFETLQLDPGTCYEFKKPVLRDEISRYSILRAVYSKRQLFEVMVGFWTDHLNINIEKGDCIYLKPSDDRLVILVQQVAAVFRQSDGDIKTLLQTVLVSDEFKQSRGTKLKRPMHFVISCLRALGADTFAHDSLTEYLARMGQSPFQYPTPDGYPEHAEHWVATLLWRWNFALPCQRTTSRQPTCLWTHCSPHWRKLHRRQRHLPETDAVGYGALPGSAGEHHPESIKSVRLFCRTHSHEERTRRA